MNNIWSFRIKTVKFYRWSEILALKSASDSRQRLCWFHIYVGSYTWTTQVQQYLFLTATFQTTFSDGKRKAFVVGDDVPIYEKNTLQEEKSVLCLPYLLRIDFKMPKINFEEEQFVNDLIDVTQTGRGIHQSSSKWPGSHHRNKFARERNQRWFHLPDQPGTPTWVPKKNYRKARFPLTGRWWNQSSCGRRTHGRLF